MAGKYKPHREPPTNNQGKRDPNVNIGGKGQSRTTKPHPHTPYWVNQHYYEHNLTRDEQQYWIVTYNNPEALQQTRTGSMPYAMIAPPQQAYQQYALDREVLQRFLSKKAFASETHDKYKTLKHVLGQQNYTKIQRTLHHG